MTPTVYLLPLDCETQMNVLQVQNGKFVYVDPVDITKV